MKNKTHRTEQLNLKVKKKFKRKLKIIAAKEDRLLTEVVEKAVILYEKKTKRQAQYRKTKKQLQKTKTKAIQLWLTPYSQINFKCDNCQRDFEQETAYSFASNWTELENSRNPFAYCFRCARYLSQR